jgi:hypothetical protein
MFQRKLENRQTLGDIVFDPIGQFWGFGRIEFNDFFKAFLRLGQIGVLLSPGSHRSATMAVAEARDCRNGQDSVVAMADLAP